MEKVSKFLLFITFSVILFLSDVGLARGAFKIKEKEQHPGVYGIDLKIQTSNDKANDSKILEDKEHRKIVKHRYFKLAIWSSIFFVITLFLYCTYLYDIFLAGSIFFVWNATLFFLVSRQDNNLGLFTSRQDLVFFIFDYILWPMAVSMWTAELLIRSPQIIMTKIKRMKKRNSRKRLNALPAN
jgi:hypothetical protein